jgi:hypothetical protein
MIITDHDVSTFADYCVYVRSVYMHGKTLFESDQADKDMLAETAPVFFGDLNKVLIEYAILQVCKITDPPKDFRGNENHTTSFFVAAADFSSEPDKGRRLAELHASMDRLREKLKPARDKVISHLDRNAALSKPIIGAASDDEWARFWRDLDEFVAILYQKYVRDPPLKILSVGNITDTLMLRNAVTKGSLFDSLARGSDKTISKMCVNMLLTAQNR